MPDTTATAIERELRLQAAGPVYKRLEADGRRVPSLAPYLTTIRARLFEGDFDVSAMWREHKVRNRSASSWFAPLKTTPKAYLTDCRLRVAARLLMHTTLRIRRISALIGYSSPVPFRKAFKTWSGGRSATQYRDKPDSDPEPWRAPLDLANVQAALKGQLSRKEGLALCRRLADHLRDLLESDVSELLALADAAQATADYEAALRHLELAAKHPERAAHQAAIDGRIALATHCRGAVLTLEGDVDRAYDDLRLARGCYTQAGVLEPSLEKRRRRLESQIPCSTDLALTSSLCPDCRRALALDVGESLRGHLRRALEMVPLDVPWFGVCCDECYRVVWNAFLLARHGLLDDAHQAWWLASHADLGDPSAPASVGRVIAALDKVDSLSWSSQEERLRLCELALSAAESVGSDELLLVTRFWRGNVLRALARFPDARKELKRQRQGMEKPWVRALHDRFLGILEQASGNHSEALAQLESAAAIYRELDAHMAGVLVLQQGNVYFDSHDYAVAIRNFRQAVPFLDGRRDPHPSRAGAVNLAMALAASGDLQEAQAELDRCHFDRAAYPSTAATEVFTRGCLAVLAGQAEEAVRLFSESQERFRGLGQLKHAVLPAVHSVEAYCALGYRERAASQLCAAGRFFEAIGSSCDTLEALAKLQVLVAEGASAREVAVHARRLAAQHGGWLPLRNRLP